MPLIELILGDNIRVFSSTKNNSNSTLFYTERGQPLLVDTFLYTADNKELLRKLDLKLEDQLTIVNTHWHSDHCYGNRFFLGEKTKFLAHKMAEETLSSERKMISAGKKFSFSPSKVPKSTESIDKDVDIEPGVKVVTTPGHTYDSIAVIITSERAIITGDTVLSSDQDHYILPYFFWGDIDDHIASLKKILSYDMELIVPGHGKPVNNSKLQSDIRYLERLKDGFSNLVSNESVIPLLLRNMIESEKKCKVEIMHKRVCDLLPLEFFLDEELIGRVRLTEIHRLNIKNLIEKYLQKNEVKDQ